MGSFFESLESRVFLSVAPSVGALKVEGEVILADLVALGKVGKANFKLIEADLNAAGETKAAKAQVKTLSVEGSAGYVLTSRDVHKMVSLITSDVGKLLAAASRLSHDPTNLTFQAKVTAAANTLQTDAANRLTTITTDLTNQQNTNAANVAAIESAFPSNTRLATDVSTTISTNTNNAVTRLSYLVPFALTSGVASVIAAFPA
ncbi:MAG TPA: hypothetical protein VK797_08840 [Tepidisphaeraceae bacterium]|jgi:hypothetical protein|nr:hypothetical protein [Tepidisphaeraceae bacterium]